MEMENHRTNIFLYLEYRKYLSDYYTLAKKTNPKFSFRYFSHLAGVKAPNFLQLLIQGKRNLKEATISNVVKALDLRTEEAEYFRLLVLFDRETATEKKAGIFKKLINMRKPYQIDTLSEKQLEHYEKWYNKAIRELLGFYKFNPDEKFAYRKLAKMVSPSISESQARSSVKSMLKLGLLKKQGTHITQTQRFISTGDELNSLFIRKFHKAMMMLAHDASDHFQPEERDISSLSISISRDGYNTIKNEIQLFRKRLLEIVKQDACPENVYQVNFQLFPLTNLKKMKKELGNAE